MATPAGLVRNLHILPIQAPVVVQVHLRPCQRGGTLSLIKAELTELMKAAPKDELLDKALSRIVITDEISRSSLDTMVVSAKKAGFLKDIPTLDQLFPKL